MKGLIRRGRIGEGEVNELDLAQCLLHKTIRNRRLKTIQKVNDYNICSCLWEI